MGKEKTNEEINKVPITVNSEKETCGIIMPISSIGGCSADHWIAVKKIISEAILDAGFNARLVSDANESGVIQGRIVQNIFNDKIIVCDVSCKNPNVMFELGMRLAFDKPIIIVMDDSTDYTFDTSIIEHVSYPRDLSYYEILEFKNNLSKKLKATFERSLSDPNYSIFLRNFGDFNITNIKKLKVSDDDIMRSRLYNIEHSLELLLRSQSQINRVDRIPRGRIEEMIDDYCSIFNYNKVELWQNEEKINRLIDFMRERSLAVRRTPQAEIVSIINDIVAPF